MNKIYSWLLLGMVTFGSTAATAAEMIDIRRAEKISLTLTGKPLSAADRTAIVQGTLSLDALAERLTKSPGFIENFAQFWTRILGIQNPVDIFRLRTARGLPNTLDGGGRLIFNLRTPSETRYTSAGLKEFLAAARNRADRIALTVVQCPDAPMIIGGVLVTDEKAIQAVVDRQVTPLGPIIEGTLPDWKNLAAYYHSLRPSCTDEVPRVKPYWDPKGVTIFARYKGVESYRVSPEVLRKCGAAIEKCDLSNAKNVDRSSNLVSADMTMEPGYIISHTVAEDRPWSEVVTTPTTIITGTYAEWLSNKGAPLWPNFPGGSYEGSNSEIFTSPDIYDRKHYRIQRNALHAGVLTTPSFQVATNGRRAKANRAYEAFLCQKFTVPQGANPDPNDSNPDLTKRAYCAFCHKTLEPMASFWNRWPDTGTINYIYNGAATINDSGAFNGQTGPGVAAFGKTLASSQDFHECGIKRAFEFVNGRKMTAIESESSMPEWNSLYEEGQQNLRPLIKAMVLSPEFLGGQK